MAKSRRARHRERPPSAKPPRVTENPDFWSSNPSWQIGTLQVKGPFGWNVLDEKKLVEILERLASLETMTWREILIEGRNNITPFAFQLFPKKIKSAFGK